MDQSDSWDIPNNSVDDNQGENLKFITKDLAQQQKDKEDNKQQQSSHIPTSQRRGRGEKQSDEKQQEKTESKQKEEQAKQEQDSWFDQGQDKKNKKSSNKQQTQSNQTFGNKKQKQAKNQSDQQELKPDTKLNESDWDNDCENNQTKKQKPAQNQARKERGNRESNEDGGRRGNRQDNEEVGRRGNRQNNLQGGRRGNRQNNQQGGRRGNRDTQNNQGQNQRLNGRGEHNQRGNWRGQRRNYGNGDRSNFNQNRNGQGRGGFRGRGSGNYQNRNDRQGQDGNRQNGGDFRKKNYDGQRIQNGERPRRDYQKNQYNYNSNNQNPQSQSNNGPIVNIQPVIQKKLEPRGRKCWPEIGLYVMKCRLNLTYRNINQQQSDLLIVPFKDCKFQLYPGNLITNNTKCNYRKKILQKQNDTLKEPGSYYFAKSVGLSSFKLLAFLKIDQSQQSIKSGIQNIIKATKSLDVKTITLPICQKFPHLEVLIKSVVKELQENNKCEFQKLELLTKEGECFKKCRSIFGELIDQLIDNNEILID